MIDDPHNSEDGDRFVLLGLSSALRRLLEGPCSRAEGNTIGILDLRDCAASHRIASHRIASLI